MRPYRENPSLEVPATDSRPRRARAALIAMAAVGLHAGLFAAAFATRAPEKTPPRSDIVTVLAGHVTETGDFEAAGIAPARIRR